MRFMPHDVSDFQILRKIKSRVVNGYLTRQTEIILVSPGLLIPPRGLRMIRRSGLYANSCAKKRVEIQRQLLASTTSHSATKCDKKSLAAVFPLEPERCPLCNAPVVCRDTTMILVPHFILRKCSIPMNQPPEQETLTAASRTSATSRCSRMRASPDLSFSVEINAFC